MSPWGAIIQRLIFNVVEKMDMDIRDLTKIGLTEGETKVYAALLDLGETTRTELAKKSGISPSKIYDVVNRLMEKGIVSSVKKQGHE